MKWMVVAAHRDTGKELRGTVEAPTQEAAEEQLRRKGLLISSIEQIAPTQAIAVVRKIDIPAPNPNLIACPACGNTISLAAPACPRCGHPMRAAPPPVPQQSVPQPQIIMQAPAAAPTVIHNVVSTSAYAYAQARGGHGCLYSLFQAFLWLVVIVGAVIGFTVWYAVHTAK